MLVNINSISMYIDEQTIQETSGSMKKKTGKVHMKSIEILVAEVLATWALFTVQTSFIVY